jgi:hypothetical protein
MIDATQLCQQVIRPVLKDLGAWSAKAEALVFGTAAQESHCGQWLVQLGQGPARGIFQMEPATHDDIWNRFISQRPDLMRKLNRWRAQYGNGMGPDEMIFNLAYAAAMCRIHYLRVPAPIPDTLNGQAEYWKMYYNTPAGAGTVEEYKQNWREFAPQYFVGAV